VKSMATKGNSQLMCDIDCPHVAFHHSDICHGALPRESFVIRVLVFTYPVRTFRLISESGSAFSLKLRTIPVPIPVIESCIIAGH